MKQGAGDDPLSEEADEAEESHETPDLAEEPTAERGAAAQQPGEGASRSGTGMDGSAAGAASSDGGGSGRRTASSQAGGSATDGSGTNAQDDVDLSEPAFPYETDMQERVYVLDKVWEDFNRTRRFEIERKLDKHGVREPEGREIDTAIIETAHNHWPEIVQRVLERRGLSIGIEDV